MENYLVEEEMILDGKLCCKARRVPYKKLSCRAREVLVSLFEIKFLDVKLSCRAKKE
jgi:hypothetical protein